jgi:hypothetical protein
VRGIKRAVSAVAMARFAKWGCILSSRSAKRRPAERKRLSTAAGHVGASRFRRGQHIPEHATVEHAVTRWRLRSLEVPYRVLRCGRRRHLTAHSFGDSRRYQSPITSH